MRRAVVAFAVTVAVLAAGVLFAGLYLARQGDEAKVLNEQAAKLTEMGNTLKGYGLPNVRWRCPSGRSARTIPTSLRS